jgi:dolichol-phosphate mannosyltransferase
MTPPTKSPTVPGFFHRFLFGDNARFLKFAAVGAAGVLVNEGLLWLCSSYLLVALGRDLRILVGGAVAIGGSILTNFVLNDFWTWGDREKRGRTHFFQRLGKYYVVAAAAAGVNYGLLLLFWKVLGVHHLVANLIGIACAMVANFFAQNRWTFAK